MIRLRWIESSHHYESLAVSLRAILAGAGDEHPYERLAALLGVGSLVLATPEESLGWWHACGRDARLAQTAELLGVRMRPLHPPAASVGLRRSAEFRQHFVDSYVPLIARALEHDQPVLAWRGWPPPRDRCWGVISEVRGGMIVGYTLWHNGQPLPMTGVAHQVYVIETSGDEGPRGQGAEGSRARKEGALFCHVASQAVEQWSGSWAARPNELTGGAAYAAWRDELRAPGSIARRVDHGGRPAVDAALPLHAQHAQAARTLGSARRHLAAWLRSIGPSLDPQHLRVAARWAGVCDRVAELLSPHESPQAVERIITDPGGIEQLAAALQAAESAERELVAALAGLEPT